MSSILTLGKIKPIECHFPHDKPYDEQLQSMHQLIDALENSHIVILESPTGTGKTKTILCSVLPWCIENKKKLIVLTRTHDQIHQFVNSIHETPCVPKVCVIASKSRTCIHPERNTFANAEDGCRESIQCNNCSSYSNIKKMIPKNSSISDIEVPIQPSKKVFDLEDIVKQSKEKDLCPYFVTKSMVSKADIICCPYNYLIDPSIFKQMNVNLKDSVVVIDEAHNVESLSRTVIHFEENLGVSFKKMIHDLEKWVNDLSIGKVATFFVLFLQNMLKFVDSVPIETKKYRNKDDTSPDEIKLERELLSKFYIDVLKLSDPDYNIEFVTNLESLGLFLMEHERIESRRKSKNNPLETKNKKLNTGILRWLQSIGKTLGFMQMNGDPKKLKKFKCVIRQPVHSKNVKRQNLNRSIHIWNMDSSLGFLHIKEMTRSFIFLSGTLHPFESIESEMDITFQVKMRLNHVIDMKKQMSAICVSQYNGEKMDSKMTNRKNIKYFDNLFKLIFDICNNTKEGILVFFPSFTFMKLCMDSWLFDRNLDKIRNIKSLFIESQGAHHSEFIKMLGAYRESCKTTRGACMFGVQRGKLSEGIDLNDECSRAVIAIGIPYPNMRDTELSLKMQYNDEKSKEEKKYLSGFNYIKKEAFRSLNQSIGRCIRHINDYGMIYLVDCRFSDRGNKSCISPWLEPYVSYEKYMDSKMIQKKCSDFFSNHPQKKNHVSIQYENEETQENSSKKIKIQ